jgi:hypothetical protein
MKHTKIPALCAAIALATTLSACGGGKKENDKDSESKGDSSESPSASVDPANVTQVKLRALPTVKKRKGAADDLTIGKCNTDAGRQAVAGKIKSSAKDTVDYLVTISWTNDTSDVMGQGFVVLEDVAPRSTTKFKIKTKVGEGATRCVTGAEYGVIG